MACDYIKALDLAKAGKWDEAHELVQQYSDPLSCRIHAYLHREEGDLQFIFYVYIDFFSSRASPFQYGFQFG
jgi:hypothetical protein